MVGVGSIAAAVWSPVAAKEMANVGHAVVGGALAAIVATWATAK